MAGCRRGAGFDLGAFTAAVLVAAVPVCSGCFHITHSSNVRPGWSGQIVGGITEEKVEPPAEYIQDDRDVSSAQVAAAQLNLGYGREYAGGKALYAGLMVPFALHDASPVAGLAATTLDLYFQFAGGPFDAGVGALAGLTAGGLYLEAGKTVSPGGGSELHFDAGVAAISYIPLRAWTGSERSLKDVGVKLFTVVSRQGRAWEFGLWADRESFGEPLQRCDENCDADDWLKSSWSAGVMVGRKFSR